MNGMAPADISLTIVLQASDNYTCEPWPNWRMKTALAVLLLSGIAFPLIAADSTNQDATTVGSKITDVTLYADRARITRTANLTLGSGVTHLAFPKLPGWIDEGSLRVSLTPATAAELLDVQVEKTFLARPDDEEIRKAEAVVTD